LKLDDTENVVFKPIKDWIEASKRTVSRLTKRAVFKVIKRAVFRAMKRAVFRAIEKAVFKTCSGTTRPVFISLNFVRSVFRSTYKDVIRCNSEGCVEVYQDGCV
jgi:hypothetical protein